MSTIGEIAKAVGNGASLALNRSNKRNTAQMRANELAKKKKKFLDKITRDVAKWDLVEIRKDASE